MSEWIDPFGRILNSYKAAVFDKDVEAFLALYDEEVHVFDMCCMWSLRGLASWRKMTTKWFSSLDSDRVVINIKNAEATLSGQLAVGHAILTYTAISDEGIELRSLSNRITMAIKHSGQSWKIMHEHTSAPIDPRSLKAELQYADVSLALNLITN